MAALSHDIAEHEVGDIPSPTKRALGLRKMLHEYESGFARDALGAVHGALPAEEKLIIKLADCLDGVMFCYREARLGNSRMRGAFYNFRSYAADLLKAANDHQIEVLTSAIHLCEELL